jgi:hypothetical protein
MLDDADVALKGWAYTDPARSEENLIIRLCGA